MKFFIRKCMTIVGVLLFGVLAAGSAFAADVELWTEYGATAYFINDKTDYRSYAFDALRMDVIVPLSLSPTGGKVFLDGYYNWITEDEKDYGTQNSPDGFVLRKNYSTSTIWTPSYNGQYVLFYDSAANGLPGREVSVELESGNEKDIYDFVLPGYRPPEEQMRTFVPYVQLTGNTFKWHFITPHRMNAIEMPCEGTFDRISVVDDYGNNIYDEEVDEDFDAGEKPEGRVDVPRDVFDILKDHDFAWLQVEYTVWENGRTGPASHYVWYYFPSRNDPDYDDDDGGSGCNAAGFGFAALLMTGTVLLLRRRK